MLEITADVMPKFDLKVDDVHELNGHCLVCFPDGSVVTASREIKLVMPGVYRVIYANDSGMEHVTASPVEGSTPVDPTPATGEAAQDGQDAPQDAAVTAPAPVAVPPVEQPSPGSSAARPATALTIPKVG